MVVLCHARLRARRRELLSLLLTLDKYLSSVNKVQEWYANVKFHQITFLVWDVVLFKENKQEGGADLEAADDGEYTSTITIVEHLRSYFF